MLIAYVDNSGTHDGSHNSVLGGYYGTEDQWSYFNDYWRDILNNRGIREFHANETWHCKGPYKNWNRGEVQSFINQLLLVIKNSQIVPFYCGVIKDAWDNLSPIQRQILSMTDEPSMRKAEFLAFQWIVTRCSNCCPPDTTMEFVFDKDSPHIMTALECVFNEIKCVKDESGLSLYSRIGNLKFEDSKSSYPLQAADLLAFEGHRGRQNKGDDSCPIREEHRFAISNHCVLTNLALYDKASLQRLCNELEIASM